jgi:hypothetical protein
MTEILTELRRLAPDVADVIEMRDGPEKAAIGLASRFSPEAVAVESREQTIWELVGVYYYGLGRSHEAIEVFAMLYTHMVAAQQAMGRVHKGMPLVRIADAYRQLGCPIHAKRFMMLTLCEDAIRGEGVVDPASTGTYFRLVWQYGLAAAELDRYAKEFARLAAENPKLALFPEFLLQQIDDRWLIEFPSALDFSIYRLSPLYAQHLLRALGSPSGRELELLAHYLMTCMAGCRATRRRRSQSTDYDIVCAMEGPDLDFRSEFGRYFVCECKDWSKPADFTVMAKFCRVLDSVKARFGILFSRRGVSGAGRASDAEREQVKVFADRGIVIVVLDEGDLESVAKGTNLIQLLRQRYESVRLDLKGRNT